MKQRTFVFFKKSPNDHHEAFVIWPGHLDASPGKRIIVIDDGVTYVLTFDVMAHVEHPTLDTKSGVVTYSVRASKVGRRDTIPESPFEN